jgi:aminoglycoside phosphotransferase (APT) family kinase protein
MLEPALSRSPGIDAYCIVRWDPALTERSRALNERRGYASRRTVRRASRPPVPMAPQDRSPHVGDVPVRTGDVVAGYTVGSVLEVGPDLELREASRADGQPARVLLARGLDPRAGEALLRLHQRLRASPSPGLPAVLALGRTAAGTPYVVLAPVQGQPVSEATCLLPMGIAALGVAAADVLAAAHARRVFHGALSPECLWIAHDGSLSIERFGRAELDLDEARAASEDERALMGVLARLFARSKVQLAPCLPEGVALPAAVVALAAVLDTERRAAVPTLEELRLRLREVLAIGLGGRLPTDLHALLAHRSPEGFAETMTETGPRPARLVARARAAPESESSPQGGIARTLSSPGARSAPDAQSLSPAPLWREGHLVAHRYRLEALVGEGGMGAVFRAYDTALQRPVALKTLRAEPSAEADAVRNGAMLNEARAIAAIHDPHVVAVHDVGEDGGVPYIAMEYVDGELLRARLRRGPPAPREAIRILSDVARGLCAAHEKGIVHRDVKPENVMLARDGSAKVLDFGVADRSALPSLSPSAPGSAAGTRV